MSNYGALARILKFARNQAGLTQEQLAGRMNFSSSLIAKFETSRLIPKADTARRLDAMFDSGDLFQELAAEARANFGQPIWVRPWLEHERNATMIRSFQPLIVPGLLQTEEYARAILTDGGNRVSDIESAVAGRLARADVLHRADTPCRLFAVLDETLLRRPIGGPAVMREQLQAIVKACAEPNVEVAVVPSSTGTYPGLNGPLVLGTVDGRTVAILDSPLGGQVIEDPDEVALLEELWEAVRGYVLPRQTSLDLITEAAESWN
ncbi:helix-turn-helix domain-containing protein [Micromonospora sp. NBC_01813]|uniref:helix-turn-helix domain-containing protein n=1 Tax=Micromonospora sp. NBC_01813 TaxID=2975988 RepID=UPI002DD7EBBC|nr:helix-turn-helix transcriptional regulator [Micromonospora sp. NBC_01813]WSA09965.1 helix-turn-helix transcriptional regulator [Micromonospora sp. NBC_01813]